MTSDQPDSPTRLYHNTKKIKYGIERPLDVIAILNASMDVGEPLRGRLEILRVDLCGLFEVGGGLSVLSGPRQEDARGSRQSSC